MTPPGKSTKDRPERRGTTNPRILLARSNMSALVRLLDASLQSGIDTVLPIGLPTYCRLKIN